MTIHRNAASAREAGAPPRTPAIPETTSALPANPSHWTRLTNRSLFAVAKNVTITAIQATTSTGSPLTYRGTLPVALSGGTALLVGRTASLPLNFNGTSSAPAFLAVTVKADNLPPFSTTLLQSNTNPPPPPVNQ